MRKPDLLIAKSNAQNSCGVTKQLISIFVLATWIVQSLFFLTTEKSSLKPFSLVVHPSLCRILLEIPKRGFLPTWCNTEKVALIYFIVMFVK